MRNSPEKNWLEFSQKVKHTFVIDVNKTTVMQIFYAKCACSIFLGHIDTISRCRKFDSPNFIHSTRQDVQVSEFNGSWNCYNGTVRHCFRAAYVKCVKMLFGFTRRDSVTTVF